MPHPNDPKLRSFIPVDPASDFPIQNLPYGVFSARDGLAPRVGVAIGDYVLDLWQLAQDCRFDVRDISVFAASTLNPFMALGPKVWSSTRARVSELLRHDHPELRDNEKLRKRALARGAERVYAYRKLFEDGPATIAAWIARGGAATTPA